MGGRRRIGEPRRWLSWGKRVGGGLGKSGPHSTLRRDAESIQMKSLIPCCQEKSLASSKVPVPQTDTGGRVENTKAIGRTVVKELGKIPP